MAIIGKIIGLLTLLLIVAAGVGLVVVGVVVRSDTQAVDGGQTVQGRVVSVAAEADRSAMGVEGVSYRPTVEFVDPGTGQSGRVVAVVASGGSPAIGSVRDVSVLPGDPSSAVVLGDSATGWYFIGIGIFALAFALGIVLLSVWVSRNMPAEELAT